MIERGIRTCPLHFNSDREHESSIHDFRIKKDMSLQELAIACGTTASVLSALATGAESPVYQYRQGLPKGYKVGDWKPFVSRLFSVLKVQPHELFPRYVCSIKRDDPDAQPFTDNQLDNLVLSDFSRFSACPDIVFAEVAMKLRKAISTLKPKYRQVLKMRFVLDLSLEQCSQELTVTRERVRQIEARALRFLRHPSRGLTYWKDKTA